MQTKTQKRIKHRYEKGKSECNKILKQTKTTFNALVDYLRENKQPDINKVKEFIESGANINAKDHLDRTSLMYATENRQANIINFLLEQGVDVNYRNKHKESALIIASSIDARTARLLIEKGAKVNIRDANGWTPLMIASQLSDIQMVKLLLKKSADVNLQANNKKTALLYACENESKNIDIIKLLLEHGAKTNQYEANVIKIIKANLPFVKKNIVKSQYQEILELIENMNKEKKYEQKMVLLDNFTFSL